MSTIIGIFRVPATAEAAVNALRARGLSNDQLLFLTPRSMTDLQATTLPGLEPQGACGATTGQVVGAITGFGGGTLSGAVALLLIPEVGLIFAIGALAFGGLLGTVFGAAAGNAVEKTMATATTYEDMLVCKHILRQGGNLLIVDPSNDTKAETATQVFAEFGAEHLDTVRAHWQDALRRSEAVAVGRPLDGFTAEEISYLWGREAARDPRTRGKSYEEAAVLVQKHELAAYHSEPFRHGYESALALQPDSYEEQPPTAVNLWGTGGAPRPHDHEARV
ncbi:MAG: hypothetical protein HOP18_13000 [Deltaproteobacteria bacterium]|nr:hypothetical protein [Deltaproteobacteria bacterium]